MAPAEGSDKLLCEEKFSNLRDCTLCSFSMILLVMSASGVSLLSLSSSPKRMTLSPSEFHNSESPRKILLSQIVSSAESLNVVAAKSPKDDPHRPGFHFRPEANWMNDPNAPMYFNGYYHLFYQYNPSGAVWGNISWGHAVSTDLINWLHLPLALQPDMWYDANGVWSGSATMLPGGQPVILYTGSSDKNVQLQNKAYPANVSDPYLIEWLKDSANPFALPPAGVKPVDFRDPSTALLLPDNSWRVLLGSRQFGTDVVLVYKSQDFKKWTVNERPLFSAPGRIGMWECPELFPVYQNSDKGLDYIYYTQSEAKYLLKGSFDDYDWDYYAIGDYNIENDTWSPVDKQRGVQDGQRFDYGKFYASKSFFDPKHERRVLWGWINESDSRLDDVRKGWASIQSIPRKVWLDPTTKKHILQMPIEEVKQLRTSKTSLTNKLLQPTEVFALDVSCGSQLDVELEIAVPFIGHHKVLSLQEFKRLPLSLDSCSPLGTYVGTKLATFGLLVLASEGLLERSAVFFELSQDVNGLSLARICSDMTRSSLSESLEKATYGRHLRLDTNARTLQLRVLVDNSVIEAFAQGGQAVLTTRAYPQHATNGKAGVYLFNDGPVPVAFSRVDVWKMKSATFTTY